MPIQITDRPAMPECSGTQWTVVHRDDLAHLVALVLLGRVRHAERILQGAQRQAVAVSSQLRARLKEQLLPPAGADPWHRDGLLFEVICWLAARKSAAPTEVISDPHLKSTQQGADTVKVQFDPNKRSLVRVTVYEYKCTDKARRRFKREILPAFAEYASGLRDDQLAQTTVSLLFRFELTDPESVQVYDRLINERPLAFRAALTVAPDVFGEEKCVRLFKDYSRLNASFENRFGDTLPLGDIRTWFEGFAQSVWENIEAADV